jgi:transposase, IS5 family
MANPRQIGLFDGRQPKRADILIKDQHELVQLADIMDWPELIETTMMIRSSKVKAESGPQPHYRELLGAVTLMAVRNVTFRQAEDLIAHYAPARYLCNLMDSTWQPDHITIFEFTQMLGPAGMDIINRKTLIQAEALGILDSTNLMSDTTAQEAMIPYPNEVGLMKRFTDLVGKNLKKVGGKFSKIKGKVKEIASKVKGLVRRSHLFAKTKEEKRKVGKRLYHTVQDLQGLLKDCLNHGLEGRSKASKELARLSELMSQLLPQILHFLNTGFVAAKKIIHLQSPELYSIVRGKAGKSVEFGLKWGINRIDGFALGFLINAGVHASDQKFCIQGIKEHISIFDEAPKKFGFDRGGYSKANIRRAKKLGVKQVGIAPTGKAKWSVSEKMAETIRRERAQVEGVIGNLKSKKYGFNKPNAKSTRAMETYGHRSFLGFNLVKMIREMNSSNLQPA